VRVAGAQSRRFMFRAHSYPQDFRQQVLEFYQDHTAKECGRKFNVSEFSVIEWARGTRFKKRLFQYPRREGDNNPAWRGGKKIRQNGAGVLILVGSRKYRDEHVLIAERVLGRKLKEGELVHHINGNPQDNRNANLLICSRSFHVWLHRKLDSMYGVYHPRGDKSLFTRGFLSL